MYSLSYRDEQGNTGRHELQPGDTLVGRASTCGLVVNNPSVSRQHVRVSLRDGRCFVSDSGSTFGTFRNDARIEGEVELRPGDRFLAGRVAFQLEKEEPLGVSLSEDRQVIEPSATIYRRVDDLVARSGTGDQGAQRFMHLLSEISKTLVTVQPLPMVLEKVVDLAFGVIAADRVFLLLRDSADQAVTPRVVRQQNGRVPERATISRTVVNMVMRDRVAMLATDALSDSRLEMAGSIQALNIRSFMCAPLWNRNDVIGVLYADNPRTRTFSADDLTAFTALSNYAAVAIEQARLSDQLLEETRRRERLQRYHSPAVVNRILHASASGGFVAQEREITVMFCDLVGFTSMSEQMSPTAVAAVLNDFFTRMTDVIFEHEGTLDKYIGDAMLAVFGAPFDQEDHPLEAVKAALGMRTALARMNAEEPSRTLRMRIAIHTGRALAGDIGSPRRREFTVLGDTVNTTSRIESSVAKPGQIVVSKSTYDRLRGAVKAASLGEVVLRGKTTGIEMFEILD